MKIAAALTSILLALAAVGLPRAAAQSTQNECFAEFIQKGDAALRRSDYDRARRQYMAALECEGLDEQLRSTANFRIEDAERKRRRGIEGQRDAATSLADSLSKVQKKLVSALAESDSLQKVAQAAARRSLGNELGFKALVNLRDGDRTAALRLAEFIHQFTDPGNAKATEAIVAAAYWNSDIRNRERLPWRVQTLVEDDSRLVTAVQFSPDGARVGIVTDHFSATIFEVETGRVLFDWNPNSPYYLGAKFSPELRSLAITGSFGKVEIVDTGTGKQRFAIGEDNARAGIEDAQFSADGTRLALTDALRAVAVFDVFSGKMLLQVAEDTLRYAVHFDPNLRKIAVASLGHAAEIWDCTTGKKTKLPTSERMLFACAFSPDGSRVAAALEDKTIGLFDTDKGDLLWKYHIEPTDNQIVAAKQAERESWPSGAAGEPAGAPYRLAFSKNGARLTAFFLDQTAKIFAVQNDILNPLWTVKSSLDGLDQMEITPDANLVLFAAFDGLEILDPLTASEQKERRIQRPSYRDRAEGSATATAAVAQRELLVQFEGQFVPPYTFSPDGKRFAWGQDGSGSVTVRDFECDISLRINQLNAEDTQLLAFSNDGKFLCVARKNGAVEIWDASGQALPLSPDAFDSTEVRDVTYSPDSSKIAVSSDDFLTILDARSGATLFRKTDLYSQIDFSADGQKLLLFEEGRSTSSLDTLHILDASTGRPLFFIPGKALRWAEFCGGGRFIWTDMGGWKRLFEAETGRPVAFLPQDSCRAVEVSPDGKTAVFRAPGGLFAVETASGRTTKLDATRYTYDQIWGKEPSDPQQKKADPTDNLIGNYYPLPLSFSPDGKRLLVLSSMGSAAIFEQKTWKKVAVFACNANEPPFFTPDGRYVAAANYLYMSLWDASSGRFINGAPTGGWGGKPAISHDGRWAAIPQENQIVMFDLRTLQVRATLRGHRQVVRQVAFSPDNKMLASASDDRSVRCWNLATGREIFAVSGDSTSTGALRFSPDGRMLTAWYSERTCTWVVEPDALLARLRRTSTIASLTEGQIYQFNLEQAFSDSLELALRKLAPPAQLAFARYFAEQANISPTPEVYSALFQKTEKLFQRAISGLDSEIAVLELGAALTDWAFKLRGDTLFTESRAVARRAVGVFKTTQNTAVQSLVKSGLAHALAADRAAAEEKWRQALAAGDVENDISAKLETLAKIGDDRKTWETLLANLDRLRPKASGEFFGLNGLEALASPDALFNMGEHEQAATNALLDVSSNLLALHRNPEPQQAALVAEQLGNLSWFYLFTKKGAPLARRFGTAGLALDSSQLFVYTNIGHSYLLEGDLLQAVRVYTRWKDAWLDSHGRLFADAVLDDLEKFAEMGKPVWSKDVLRAAEILIGKENWTESERLKYEPHGLPPEEELSPEQNAKQGEEAPKSKKRRKKG